MDKISLYDYIISDENIYLSIYSAKSYILNKSLLGKKDKELLNSLNDPFNENIIYETTKSVKEIVKKILDDKDYLKHKFILNLKNMKINLYIDLYTVQNYYS